MNGHGQKVLDGIVSILRSELQDILLLAQNQLKDYMKIQTKYNMNTKYLIEIQFITLDIKVHILMLIDRTLFMFEIK